jgi:hypothetical protein
MASAISQIFWVELQHSEILNFHFSSKEKGAPQQLMNLEKTVEL